MTPFMDISLPSVQLKLVSGLHGNPLSSLGAYPKLSGQKSGLAWFNPSPKGTLGRREYAKVLQTLTFSSHANNSLHRNLHSFWLQPNYRRIIQNRESAQLKDVSLSVLTT